MSYVEENQSAPAETTSNLPTSSHNIRDPFKTHVLTVVDQSRQTLKEVNVLLTTHLNDESGIPSQETLENMKDHLQSLHQHRCDLTQKTERPSQKIAEKEALTKLNPSALPIKHHSRQLNTKSENCDVKRQTSINESRKTKSRENSRVASQLQQNIELSQGNPTINQSSSNVLVPAEHLEMLVNTIQRLSSRVEQLESQDKIDVAINQRKSLKPATSSSGTSSDSDLTDESEVDRKSSINNKHRRSYEHHSSCSPNPQRKNKGISAHKAASYLFKFDGTGNLKSFQDCFSEFVINNPNIKDKIKFVLLENHLEGNAKNFLQYLSNPLEAIRETFYELNQVFRKDVGTLDVVHTLYKRLESLPFHQTNYDQMVIDLSAHRTVVNLLRDKKANVDDCSTIDPLICKLPMEIKHEVVLGYIKDNKSWTFKETVDNIATHIKHLRIIDNLNHGTGEASTALNYKPGAPKITQDYTKLNEFYAPKSETPNWRIVSFSFPFPQPETRHVCSVCEGAHHTVRCPLTSSEFRSLLMEKGLCEKCAKNTHNTENCTAQHACGYCMGSHHMGSCPRKDFYRNPKNFCSTEYLIQTHEQSVRSQRNNQYNY